MTTLPFERWDADSICDPRPSDGRSQRTGKVEMITEQDQQAPQVDLPGMEQEQVGENPALQAASEQPDALTLETLSAGKPVVAIPFAADQPGNATLLRQHGCPLSVDPATATAAQVAAPRSLTSPCCCACRV